MISKHTSASGRLGGTMEWLWLAVAALIGLAVAALIGFFVGMSLLGRALESVASERELNMASDRELMLSTFRRELANYMVQADPDRFLRLYQKARAAEAAIGSADKAEREAQYTIITKKCPMYADFDLVATREHVLYADALSAYSLEDIEDHYLNLVKFHALKCVLDEGWRLRGAATSDRDLEHLKKYVQKIKDTKFRQRLVAAVDEFYLHGFDNRLDHAPGEPDYKTKALAVYRVHHFAEIRYGVHFKDTDEFGLYGSFHGDDDREYRGYYRSDHTFKAEIYLDHLHFDEQI
jgi:hypothetical protein